MLIPTAQIFIIQQATAAFPNRKKAVTFFFSEKGETNISVAEMVSTAQFTFPKKVVVNMVDNGKEAIIDNNDTGYNATVNDRKNNWSLDSQNILIGGITEPLIQRGDHILISTGYQDGAVYADESLSISQQTSNIIFDGFISKIDPGSPITIWAEDYMYILKQVQCNEVDAYDTAAKGNSLDGLIQKIIAGKTYTVDGLTAPINEFFKFNYDGYETNIGGPWTVFKNATILKFLDEIKSKCEFTIYCEDNIIGMNNSPGVNTAPKRINIGLAKYYTVGISPKEFYSQYNYNFHFQKNIIKSSLIYQRFDDVKIKLKGWANIKMPVPGKTNKDGSVVYKMYKCFAEYGDEGGDEETQQFFPPKNENGIETYTDATIMQKSITEEEITYTAPDLLKQVIALFPRIKYEGFKGSFETFGVPAMKPGMLVTFFDDVIRERNNTTYFVKSVRTSFGTSGIRQEIEIDYRYYPDTATQQQLNNNF